MSWSILNSRKDEENKILYFNSYHLSLANKEKYLRGKIDIYEISYRMIHSSFRANLLKSKKIKYFENGWKIVFEEDTIKVLLIFNR